MAILFIAEISEKEAYPVGGATPTNDHDKIYNIYELYIGEHKTGTYWTDWNGYYDNIVAQQVELFFGQFLRGVFDYDALYATPYTFLIDGDHVLFNVPLHPWLYDSQDAYLRSRRGYISGAPNPDNPADTRVSGEVYSVRLKTPSFSVKLSDIIAGLVKYETFDFTLYNHDGFFDAINETNLFNTPVRIKKAWIDHPEAEDFITIREGLLDNIEMQFDEAIFSCADKFRSLDEPVCKTISADEYTITKTATIDSDLPIAYGDVQIDLIPLTDTTFLAAEVITAVSAVYDSDGVSLAFTFDSVTGVITELTGEADYADVTGITTNRVGQIVVDLIYRKSNISYAPSDWDTVETDPYLASSPFVNVVFDSGTVKEAIADVLKSDMAFLIQKHNGYFSLREWGKTYQIHNVPSWKITKTPKKTFEDAKDNYFSSCVVKYDFSMHEDTHLAQALYNGNEAEALAQYNKSARREFETYLTSEANALELAARLSSRFTLLREELTVSVGVDTGDWNLLDSVHLVAVINGREFSTKGHYIIKEINPAQDQLVLEESPLPDYSGESPYTTDYAVELDNLDPSAVDGDFEYIIDGGLV